MIGDVLTSSILIEALRYRYPEAQIDYLINSHTRPVMEHNPHVSNLVVYTPEIEKKVALRKAFRKRIKTQNYDVVIDVYSKIRSVRITLSTKARIRIGYRKWYTKAAYTHTYRTDKIATTSAGLAIENRIKLLKGLEDDFPTILKPKIYLTEEEHQNAKRALAQYQVSSDRPLFMISILGSTSQKTYPLDYLVELLDYIVAQTKATLLFNYIPRQVDAVQELLELCTEETRRHIIPELYGTTLREFMTLTAQCDGLIGNEGGAVNMAKALTVPTFSIFSPWIRKEVWAIYEDPLNVSVHLADFEKDLRDQYTAKQIKKESVRFYRKLTPALLIPQLATFLSRSLS